MGIYSHYTVDQLTTLRDTLTQSLHDRLTKPTSAGSATRNAQYQQRTDDIRKEIAAVIAEIDVRSGNATRGPIYLTRCR